MSHPSRAGTITLGGGGTSTPSTTAPQPGTAVPDDWAARMQKLIDGLLAAFDDKVSRKGMLDRFNKLSTDILGVTTLSTDDGSMKELLDAYEVTRASDDRRGWFDFLTVGPEFGGIEYHELPEEHTNVVLVVVLLVAAVAGIGLVIWLAKRKRGQGRRR